MRILPTIQDYQNIALAAPEYEHMSKRIIDIARGISLCLGCSEEAAFRGIQIVALGFSVYMVALCLRIAYAICVEFFGHRNPKNEQSQPQILNVNNLISKILDMEYSVKQHDNTYTIYFKDQIYEKNLTQDQLCERLLQIKKKPEGSNSSKSVTFIKDEDQVPKLQDNEFFFQEKENNTYTIRVKQADQQELVIYTNLTFDDFQKKVNELHAQGYKSVAL